MDEMPAIFACANKKPIVNCEVPLIVELIGANPVIPAFIPDTPFRMAKMKTVALPSAVISETPLIVELHPPIPLIADNKLDVPFI